MTRNRSRDLPPVGRLYAALESLRRRLGKAPTVADMVGAPLAQRKGTLAPRWLALPAPDVEVADVQIPSRGGDLPVRTYRAAEGVLPAVLYLHGGGWALGGLDTLDHVCRRMAKDAGVVVVSVDYRLAPEHPFPAGLEDLQAAWAWSQRAYGGLHALGGDSAGGNLAAALTLRLTAAGADRPLFLLLLYPVLALPDSTSSYRTNATAFPIGAADMRWFFRHYLPDDAPSPPTPDLAPLQATTLTFLPPTHLVLAGHDPLHDEGAALAARLATEGVAVTTVEHPGLCHGFLRFTAASAAARDARSEIVDAVRRLARHSPARSEPVAGGSASAGAASQNLATTEESR